MRHESLPLVVFDSGNTRLIAIGGGVVVAEKRVCDAMGDRAWVPSADAEAIRSDARSWIIACEDQAKHRLEYLKEEAEELKSRVDSIRQLANLGGAKETQPTEQSEPDTEPTDPA